MGGLKAQLERFAAAELARLRLRVRLLARKTALLALAGLLAVFALAMFVAAAFMALAEAYGPVLGAAITGAGLVVATLFVLMLASAGGRPPAAALPPQPAPPHPAPPPSPELEAALLAQRLGREAEAAIRRNAPEASLAALVAGVALGASPKLRRALRDLLS